MNDVAWFVGIDWGSESHAVCLVDATGRRREVRRIAHTAEAVETCLAWILECAEVPPTRIAVAIETPRGALIDACLVCGFRVFAVNPKQLDRFRDRHTVAGAKDDRRDAWVLADSLRTDAAAFQPVHQEDPIVVQLRELSRAEDDLDGEFRRLANQLRSQLHRLVPEILALCPGADEPWLWALLTVAPSPMEQRRLTRARVDHLLRAHRIRRWRADDVLARLQAPHFPHAPGVAEAVEAQIRLILPRLEVVHAQRLVCGRQLEQLLQQLRDRPRDADERGEHRDIAILESLPGVGRKVAVTMLAEAAGPLAHRDYDRLRAHMGTAPTTSASGKRRLVSMRRACNRKLRWAAYHWGRASVQHDPASAAYYRALRARGHRHGRALRSVVDRWLRILMAMLRHNTLYDAGRFAVAAENGA
ncbi:MAG TPA: IS110 family transposase [Gemmatimonadales bacterium]|jgi:transposase|nr:IS110 family transposase [Gemmatimonadales bacterium]